MKHYYMTFCNDGVELFGTECKTRKEAIAELKEAYRFDCGECEYDPCDFNEYYIEERWETDDELIVGESEYYKLTMGKRGGVTCKRI